MDIVFFVALLCLIAYVGYRNFELLRRYRHNKQYIDCYRAMLNNDEDAYEKVNTFIENENSLEYRNKGLILRLFIELGRSLDYRQTLEELDLKEIFYKKGKYSKQLVTLNSDIFIWYYLDMARARRFSRFDVLDKLNDKLFGLNELEVRVEFQLAKAICNALREKEDAGVEFLNGLLEGSYTQYAYEKNLIGLYKRFSASTLAYSGEPMEEYYKNDLHAFAETLIGRNYMSELEIYEKYPPLKKEEETSQDVLETNEEDKE
ncbi:MAG: hypothetical protein J6Z03_01210 [Erysipelotrichaceae bacterium]|nr:hypothetical protein [Erysipelotrichaceae bacterium]